MSIRKGEAWGAAAPLPESGVVVRTDAEARAVVEEAWLAGRPLPALGLLGGDLCRTLGGTGDSGRLHSDEAMTFPVDLGVAVVDGERHCFVAHAVARRWAWRGRFVAAMNAQWLGPYDLGPRSHPGDGLLDVTDGRLALGQRLEARRRARTGTHLPHPDLATARVVALDLPLERPLDLWLDGRRIARTVELHLTVEPDALQIVV